MGVRDEWDLSEEELVYIALSSFKEQAVLAIGVARSLNGTQQARKDAKKCWQEKEEGKRVRRRRAELSVKYFTIVTITTWWLEFLAGDIYMINNIMIEWEYTGCIWLLWSQIEVKFVSLNNWSIDLQRSFQNWLCRRARNPLQELTEVADSFFNQLQ